MPRKKSAPAKEEAAGGSEHTQDFERLGVFYLGRPYDLPAKRANPGWLLYDSKDLVTHEARLGLGRRCRFRTESQQQGDDAGQSPQGGDRPGRVRQKAGTEDDQRTESRPGDAGNENPRAGSSPPLTVMWMKIFHLMCSGFSFATSTKALSK